MPLEHEKPNRKKTPIQVPSGSKSYRDDYVAFVSTKQLTELLKAYDLLKQIAGDGYLPIRLGDEAERIFTVLDKELE